MNVSKNFQTENKMLLTRTANDLLAKTENTECRALLLNYLNEHAPNTDIDGKYGL